MSKTGLLVWVLLCILAIPCTVFAQEALDKKKAAVEEPAKTAKTDEKVKTESVENKEDTAKTADSKTAGTEKAKEKSLPSEDELKEMRRKIRAIVPKDLGKEGAKEFEQLNLMIEYFSTEVKDYRKDIQDLIERRYEEKRKKINESYERAIKELEVEEKTRREEAIARFEAFLKRYPNDANYTPDALFRLSELYFEKSNLESQQAVEQYYKDMDKFERGELQVEPPEPYQDFAKMVEIYHKLLGSFPDYRYNDAVIYLLGYCLSKMGEKDEARKIFADLVTKPKFRKSRYRAEAWMLLGESFFDEGEEEDILKAIDAYKEVLSGYPDYVNYDKVLYKLAWAYYRIDRFPEAVGTFVKLIDLYEKKKKEKESKGEEVEEGVLKPEAIRYIAISYSDENWDGGGTENAIAYFKLIGQRPYEREVFRELAEVYFDQTKYQNSVASFRAVIKMDPLNEKNPEIQGRIIEAFLRLRNFEASAAEREILVKNYKPGSAWYDANRNHPIAIKTANDLAESSLAEAAFFYHQQARSFDKDGRKEDALQSYRLAAVNYGKYLERFPHTKEAYEMNFFYGDALFYAGDNEGAAQEYERVRNSTAGSKFRADAADQAVRAYNQAVLLAIKDGRIKDMPLKQFHGDKNDPPIEPKKIPELIQKLIDAGDKYLELAPEGKTAPLSMYVAAEYAFRYDQHEKTREACTRIIKNYPKHEFAKDAANLMLETYLASKDWDNVQKWAEYKAARSIGDTGESMKLANSAVFKKAELLDNQGKFEEAAKEYLRVIKRDPKFEHADGALNNAAIDYEKVHKFETALKLYERLYKEYPNSQLADAALFRVAYNAERSWNFERAIEGYQRLFKVYKDSKFREKSLYNAAINLEYIQNYKGAAREYLRFTRSFNESDLAPGSLFDAAMVYIKMNDNRSALNTFNKFIKQYNRDVKQSERIIRAHFEMSRIYLKNKNWKIKKKGMDECQTIITEYNKRGMSYAANPRASHYAAQCVFEEAMDEFYRYQKLTIGSAKPKILKKQLEDKAKGQSSVEKAFKKVYSYKSPEWSLAAAYKIGHSYQIFAQTLFDAPVPKELKRDIDAQDAYRLMLEEAAAPIEDKATKLYQRAYELCKQFNVINEWVRKIEEALAYYMPAEYPLLKEPEHIMRKKVLSAYAYLPIKPNDTSAIAAEDEKLGAESGGGQPKGEGLKTEGGLKEDAGNKKAPEKQEENVGGGGLK